MSDFDKEAERERLREKYEEDQRDRETTERMSELLLKGATMTNAHCGECSDPIFRYDGQEFCPTCQQPVADADETGAAQPSTDDESADSTDGASAGTTNAQPDQSEPATDPQSASSSTADSASADTTADSASADTTAESVSDRSLPAETGERAPGRPSERRPATPDSDTAPAGTLGDARASLERSLLRFAREAERTDDPRRAREHLEAANEAAATLATLSDIR